MNKEEAANYLGVKARTLELYASQGKLSVSYQRGKRGQVAVYDEQELAQLKEALQQPTYPQRPAIDRAIPTSDGHSLAHWEPAALAQAIGAAMGEQFAISQERFATMLASGPAVERLTVAIESKLTLSLAEAAALAGLSRGYLLAAIKAHKLKASKIGRGWRVKRADLDQYVKSI